MSNEDESTDAHLNISGPGQAYLSVSADDTPKVVDVTKTELGKSSSSVQIFWNYPVGSLTLKIGTAFTEQQKPYAIRMDKERLQPGISNVYHIVHGQETEVGINDNNIVLDSDCNYQVIVKFQGPSTMTFYGANINYDIISK